MQKSDVIRSVEIAGLGLLAGLIGTLAMSTSQALEMRLTKRKASTTPAEAVETLVGVDVPDWLTEHQLSTAAHVTFGTGLGLGLAALAKLPEPARGAVFFIGSWSAGTAMITGLGVSDPPTKWGVKSLVIDLAHHAVYAGSAALAFSGLQRLARASMPLASGRND